MFFGVLFTLWGLKVSTYVMDCVLLSSASWHKETFEKQTYFSYLTM